MSNALGKKAARYVSSDLRFTEYRTSTSPITVPSIFGHGNSFTNWGMLGNDRYGDCVWAGAAHETMLFNNLANGNIVNEQVVPFSESGVLSDYAAVTGFVPSTGEHDDGTDVHDALEYRIKTGVVDANSTRHKIAAYVALEPGNIQQLLEATFIFDAVGIGIEFPESADDQFNAGQVWSVVKGAKIVGGHYIPIVGCPATGNVAVITWGKRQLATDTFITTYCDEAYGIISQESLLAKTQANLGGFNWNQLLADAKALGQVTTS